MGPREDLVCAIRLGNVIRVEEILKICKSYEVDVNFSETLIKSAIRQKDSVIARLLIKFCASAKNKKEINHSFTTLLLYAVRRGNLEVVKILVKNGANVNGQSKNGCTALHYAASYNDVNIVKYLLKHGALADIMGGKKCNLGFTPLHCACIFGNLECAKILVKYNSEVVNPEEDDAIHPIHLSVSYSRLDVTAFLIDHIANINIRFSKKIYEILKDPFLEILELPNEGPTLLHWAIIKTDDLMAQLLIKKGANVYLTTKSGITPLMLAARDADLETIERIIERNPNVNETDWSGNTALHYAYYNLVAHRSRYELLFDDLQRLDDADRIELLYEAGADFLAECSFKLVPQLKSILDLAIYFGTHDAVLYILYKTRVGLTQLEYSTIELAAFDDNAVDDSMRSDVTFIEGLRTHSSKLQCYLAAFAISRCEIFSGSMENPLRKVRALVKELRQENTYRLFFEETLRSISASRTFLLSQRIGQTRYTCWDAVYRHQEQLVKMLFNEEIRLGFDFRRVFSDQRAYYYSNLAEYKISYAFAKQNILAQVIEILFDLLWVELPYECCEHIAYMMTNDELNRFILSYGLYGYYFF